MLVDAHQHVWTQALVDALSARDEFPYVRRVNGLTVLHCAAEPPYVVDVESESPDRRAALVDEDGVDCAVVAISSPIGIEALPRESALELIDAYLNGVESLGPEFRSWGPIAIDGADPDEVDRLLARGCVGISVTAGALAGPDRLEHLGPVLKRASERGVALFVHPGRAPGQLPTPAEFGEPLWWRPLTDYVFQMQAAWLTFAALGRCEHPDLRVVFAMLAGGAPLMSERMTARGGPGIDLRDPNTFYETSSYGPQAIEMTASIAGDSQLVYGSDRPVIDPRPTGRDRSLQINSGNLLTGVPV
ncbi:MAG: amidohydrolase [Conexibacteraceae bacterium]|nr:amidohydrolase [Conexibacteraceae bacterium]